jgi:hypothetical protein
MVIQRLLNLDAVLSYFEIAVDSHAHYLRQPFQREPDFGVTSVNYDLPELMARAEEPA